MTRTHQSSESRRSLWIPWAYVGMFGVIILVNLTMALFALDSWTGLSANDPYKRGLVHNRTQEAIRNQDKLGWQVGLAQTPQKAVLFLRFLWIWGPEKSKSFIFIVFS